MFGSKLPAGHFAIYFPNQRALSFLPRSPKTNATGIYVSCQLAAASQLATQGISLLPLVTSSLFSFLFPHHLEHSFL